MAATSACELAITRIGPAGTRDPGELKGWPDEKGVSGMAFVLGQIGDARLYEFALVPEILGAHAAILIPEDHCRPLMRITMELAVPVPRLRAKRPVRIARQGRGAIRAMEFTVVIVLLASDDAGAVIFVDNRRAKYFIAMAMPLSVS
jgi:hypothetical protein